MTMYSIKIVDCNEAEVKLGDEVKFGVEDGPAVIVEISDPDGDYDDELERSVEIPPVVTVRFSDGLTEQAGTNNITRVTWGDYPDGPAEMIYQCEDIEKV